MGVGNCISDGEMVWMRVSRFMGTNPQINREMETMKIKTPTKILSL
jgi:hypothetical protein